MAADRLAGKAVSEHQRFTANVADLLAAAGSFVRGAPTAAAVPTAGFGGGFGGGGGSFGGDGGSKTGGAGTASGGGNPPSGESRIET